MPTIAELTTPQGQSVFVELEPSSSSGLEPVKRGPAVRHIQRDLKECLDGVKPIVHAVVAALEDTADDIEKVSASFGFKISATGNIMIASGTAEGHFEITLEWAPRKKTVT